MEIHELVIEMKLLERRLTLYRRGADGQTVSSNPDLSDLARIPCLSLHNHMIPEL